MIEPKLTRFTGDIPPRTRRPPGPASHNIDISDISSAKKAAEKAMSLLNVVPQVCLRFDTLDALEEEFTVQLDGNDVVVYDDDGVVTPVKNLRRWIKQRMEGDYGEADG